MTVYRTLLAVFAVAMLYAAPAAAYWVSCEYHVSATHSDGIPFEDDQTYTGQVYVDGDYTKTGDHGNYGAASFTVDMFNVMVSAAAHSHGVEYEESRFATGAGRVPDAVFSDRIVFFIPAGDYPDGVYATLRGRSLGTVSSTVGAGARARLYAVLGGEFYDTGLLYSGIDVASTITVDETWTLTQEIVAPGTTFNNPTERNHLVTMGFYDIIAWSVELNLGDGNWATGDGDVAFGDGLRFTSFTASPGVAWVSDSGIFAGGLAAVPGSGSASGAMLRQNAPNPFNPATVIGWELEAAGTVDLRIYDVAGHLVRTLLAGDLRGEGPGEVQWRGRDDTGRDAPAGVYFYRLRSGQADLTRRMTLVR